MPHLGQTATLVPSGSAAEERECKPCDRLVAGLTCPSCGRPSTLTADAKRLFADLQRQDFGAGD